MANAKRALRSGTWPSAISTEACARRAEKHGLIAPGEPRAVGSSLYWLAPVPEEGMRATIMRKEPDCDPVPLLPDPFTARSRIYEYGGGSYESSAEAIYFTEFADGQIYALRENAVPSQLTHRPMCRYGGPHFSAAPNALFSVRAVSVHSGS